MDFGQAVFPEAEGVLLEVEAFEVVGGGGGRLGGEADAFLLDLVPAGLPASHFGQNGTLLLQDGLALLDVLAPALVAFHEDFSQLLR